MYENAFNFNARPFTSTPFVKHYFPAESIHNSLGQARLCIDRGAGPVVVVGPVGTGKSLMLAMLEDQYKSHYTVVNLGSTRLGSRGEFLQTVLFELKLQFKGLTESEARLTLVDFLKPSDQCPNGVLLLVDEAHTLSEDLLDEIRLITNYVRDGQPRVRLVMAGTQRLEDHLADPKLESFNQRIAARCYLEKMNRDETSRYVIDHIDRVGGNGIELFNTASLKTIHEVSDGCARLVNQVCDHSLILAGTRGESVITENTVREAWADVQSIPGGWAPPAEQATDTSQLDDDENWTVIEFGQLDDNPRSQDADSASEENSIVYDFSNSSESEAPEVSELPASTELPASSERPETFEQSESEHEQVDLAGIFNSGAPATQEQPSGHVQDTEPTDNTVEIGSLSSEPETVEPFNSTSEEAVKEEQSNLEDEFNAVFGVAPTKPESKPLEATESVNPFYEAPIAGQDTIHSTENSELENQQIRDLESEQEQLLNQVESETGAGDVAGALGIGGAISGLAGIDAMNEGEESVSSDSDSVEEPVASSVSETMVFEIEGPKASVEMHAEQPPQTVEEPQFEQRPELNEHVGHADEQEHAEQQQEPESEQQQQAPYEHPVSQETIVEESPNVEHEAEEIAAPAMRVPQETVDPFAETFAEEELIKDRFAPFVAHQNQSSLTITSEELDSIVPVSDSSWDETPSTHGVDHVEASEQIETSDDAEQVDSVSQENALDQADTIRLLEAGDQAGPVEGMTPGYTDPESHAEEPVKNEVTADPALSLTTQPRWGDATAYADNNGSTDPHSESTPPTTPGVFVVGQEPSESNEVEADHSGATTFQAHQEGVREEEANEEEASKDSDLPRTVASTVELPSEIYSVTNESQANLSISPEPTIEVREETDVIESLNFATPDSAEVSSETETESTHHQHVSDVASEEIQRQADEILKRLSAGKNVSHETSQDQNEPVSEAGSNKRQIPMTMPMVTVDAGTLSDQPPTETEAEQNSGDEEFNKQRSALDASQRILNEILAQKNMIAEQNAQPDSRPVPPTMQIEYPMESSTQESDQSKDDREMIIISRMEEEAQSPRKKEDPIEFPSTPVSTGRAERMDYQKLFDQLRDISKND